MTTVYRGRRVMRAAVVLLALLLASVATAQDRSAVTSDQVEGAEQQPQQQQEPLLPEVRSELPGRVGDSAVGEVGQRQTRERTLGIEPLARIASRIQNRVQSRLGTRIDRTYDPTASTTSSLEEAEDRTRIAGQRRR